MDCRMVEPTRAGVLGQNDVANVLQHIVLSDTRTYVWPHSVLLRGTAV
jgi:hypothetical protein